MKNIKFLNKETGKPENIIAGNIGEKVFAIEKNVKSVNNVIRWCNTHKSGDVFDCDKYTIEIV